MINSEREEMALSVLSVRHAPSIVTGVGLDVSPERAADLISYGMRLALYAYRVDPIFMGNFIEGLSGPIEYGQLFVDQLRDILDHIDEGVDLH